ncbi:MAG: putative DNA binding domain-containing protein [Candidatus Omnitrophica bacterium]|nr:putative DNA binding domain-containing protein [Candidatus Omnitrophota bacterium]
MISSQLQFLIQQGEGYNVEFKENYSHSLSREICAMANATGGKILIGVTDDGKLKPVNVTNKLRSELIDLARNFDPSLTVSLEEIEGILIINIPESKEKPHSTGGKFYVRQGANSQQLSRNEIRDFFISENLIHFDEIPNQKFNLAKDFKEQAYKRFLEAIGIKTKLKSKEVLKNMELLDDDDRLKNAGVLLFTKQVSKFIRGGTITCAVFMGKTKTKVIDSQEYDYDLYRNYDEAFKYIKSKLNNEYIIKVGPREEVLELPEEALREALLNAIAHRDYFSNANIQISIFHDRLVIDNPGELMGNIKIADLYKKSFPRNRLLFGLMQRMDLVEKIGSGLMRMNELMEEYLLPHPIIDVSDAVFSITFERPDLQKMSIEQRREAYQAKVGEKVSEKVSEKLTLNQERILDLIRKDRTISIVELAKQVRIAEKNIGNNLKALKNKGLIKRIGPAKGGHWEIVEK